MSWIDWFTSCQWLGALSEFEGASSSISYQCHQRRAGYRAIRPDCYQLQDAGCLQQAACPVGQAPLLCPVRVDAAVCTGNPATTPANGYWSCPVNLLPGLQCKAICDNGYDWVVSSTCQDNGTWGPVTGTCDKQGELHLLDDASLTEAARVFQQTEFSEASRAVCWLPAKACHAGGWQCRGQDGVSSH